MPIRVEVSEEFDDWFSSLSYKEVIQIDKRLLLIRKNDHLGDYKSLGDGLFELRWKNGRRVYFITQPASRFHRFSGGFWPLAPIFRFGQGALALPYISKSTLGAKLPSDKRRNQLASWVS